MSKLIENYDNTCEVCLNRIEEATINGLMGRLKRSDLLSKKLLWAIFRLILTNSAGNENEYESFALVHDSNV